MISFVTGNKQKFEEAKRLVSIKLNQISLDISEIQDVQQEKIIKHKLKTAYTIIKNPVIVEDTAVHFNALNGLPGALIKWFLDFLGCEGCYKLIENHTDKSAITRCTVGYTSNGKDIYLFTGEIKGIIVPPKGSNRFGWDRIFIPNGYSKRYSEMTIKEKNKISHRAEAFKKLDNFLKSLRKWQNVYFAK